MGAISAIAQAILAYDAEAAARLAREAVDDGSDPVIVFDEMSGVMEDLGVRFAAGECFLPELVGAAEAMQAASSVLEDAIKKSGADRRTLGSVVAGTVHGDIHSIGIQMVCTLLSAAGFDVRYLGIDVPAEVFVEAAKEAAADIVALSALLTVTASEQARVIELLHAAGLKDKVKIMVGGGAITADFALSIGADGYEPSAVGAVDLAKRLMEEQERPAAKSA